MAPFHPKTIENLLNAVKILLAIAISGAFAHIIKSRNDSNAKFRVSSFADLFFPNTVTTDDLTTFIGIASTLWLGVLALGLFESHKSSAAARQLNEMRDHIREVSQNGLKPREDWPPPRKDKSYTWLSLMLLSTMVIGGWIGISITTTNICSLLQGTQSSTHYVEIALSITYTAMLTFASTIVHHFYTVKTFSPTLALESSYTPLATVLSFLGHGNERMKIIASAPTHSHKFDKAKDFVAKSIFQHRPHLTLFKVEKVRKHGSPRRSLTAAGMYSIAVSLLLSAPWPEGILPTTITLCLLVLIATLLAIFSVNRRYQEFLNSKLDYIMTGQEYAPNTFLRIENVTYLTIALPPGFAAVIHTYVTLSNSHFSRWAVAATIVSTAFLSASFAAASIKAPYTIKPIRVAVADRIKELVTQGYGTQLADGSALEQSILHHVYPSGQN